MIVSITYMVLASFFGLKWTLLLLAITAFTDMAIAAQMPYIVHGPGEEFAEDVWEVDE